ncbi:MAG: TolC family protein [Acidobacteria bacterium]|nr:TolC family protein [Acidobacteriota bacterium]
MTLAELERLALQANPTLRGAEAQVEASRNRARQAGAWPNPTMGYSGEEIKLGDIDRRGEHGFFVEQSILLGGKRRLNRAVFDRATERAEAELETQRFRVSSSTRAAFYRALAAERRVEVQERLAALVSEAVAITAQLFNVGAADRPDFLESEIEAQRVQLELNAARNRVFAMRQQLAAVVGQADIAGRALVGTLEDALPELEREATLQRYLEQSPQLRAARAALAGTQASTAVARRETFPDLFVRGGAAYNRERGEDSGRPIGWEGGLEVGVSVPLFDRNRYGVAAARAEETRATADVQRLELSLRAQVAMAFSEYLTALRESESYRREIIPKAEEAYRLYLARYREMAAAYPQVLIAQRTLFELSSRYLERVEEAWRGAMEIQGFLAGEGLASPGEVDAERRERGGRQ